MKDSEYHGPYRQSPDKTFMVSAISAPTRGASSPTEFVLVNLEEKKILLERKSHQRQFVEDVAWSPDARMFIVLDESSSLYLGISGIFRILIGHPAVVCKFYLSIYDRTGNLLVHSKVASGLIDGGGQVSWNGEAEGSK
jgi:hypothetical protein